MTKEKTTKSLKKSKSAWKDFNTKPNNKAILIYFEKPFDNSNIHVAFFKELNNGISSAMIAGKWFHNLESYNATHWTELPKDPTS